MLKLSGVDKLLRGESDGHSTLNSTDLERRYVEQLSQTYVEHFNRPTPRILWHYTSKETFKNILASNQLWFTHVSKLNDRGEVIFAADLSRKLLKDRLSEGDVDSDEKEILTLALNTLIDNNSHSTWFVSCFSEARDDLSQWRAYGDNSRGVAIGFDTVELAKFFSKSTVCRPMMTSVCYDEQTSREFGRSLIALTVKNFKSDFANSTKKSAAARSFLGLWGPKVDVFSVVPKHPKFDTEREWRLAVQQDYGQKLFDTLLPEAPRVLKLSRGQESDSHSNVLPIVAVDVGPLADSGSERDISESLQAHDHVSVNVARSKIPLRDTNKG